MTRVSDARCPHRLAAQDGALSRLKQGFESPWGHLKGSIPNYTLWLKSSSFRCSDLSIEENWRNCSPTESDWFGMFALIGQSDGKEVQTYISVKDAWKLYGYKRQYLRRLLRQKKLSRKKVGQVWLIEVSSLQNYLLLADQLQDKRFGPRVEERQKPIKASRFRNSRLNIPSLA